MESTWTVRRLERQTNAHRSMGELSGANRFATSVKKTLKITELVLLINWGEECHGNFCHRVPVQ